MTYRERRLARADRLRGWAGRREAEATTALSADAELRSDWAFITQPGRIPARDRMNRRDERAFRSLDKAEGMRARADEIARQAGHAIYSDDEDAIDRLRERIVELEVKREAIKAHNKAARKSGADRTPAYVLANLNGNLKRNRDRLADLERRAARAAAAEDAGGVIVARGGGYARVTFAEKPDADVRHELKAAGFRWGAGSWIGPADRLPAKYEGSTS